MKKKLRHLQLTDNFIFEFFKIHDIDKKQQIMSKQTGKVSYLYAEILKDNRIKGCIWNHETMQYQSIANKLFTLPWNYPNKWTVPLIFRLQLVFTARLDFRTFLENMKMSSSLSKNLETGMNVFKSNSEIKKNIMKY